MCRGLLKLFLVGLLSSSVTAQTESLTLRWDPNREADISRYRLERAVNSTVNFQFVQEISHPNTEFLDQVVAPGNLYVYRIAAINQTGATSLYSAAVSAGLPKIDLSLSSIAAEGETILARAAFIRDPDDDPDDMQLQVSNAQNVQIDIRSDEIRITPVPADYIGRAEFDIRVEDGNGFFDQKTIQFDFVTAGINTAPHLQFPASLNIPADSSLTVSLVNYVVDSTSSINELNWDFNTDGNLSAQFNTSENTLHLIPDAGFQGESQLTISVSDPAGLEDEQTITVNVGSGQQEDNPPPVITREGPELVVYPNPIKTSRGHNEMIFLNLPDVTQSISVFSVAGEKVFEEEISSSTLNEYRINISNDARRFPSGLYVYMVKGENSEVLEKGRVAIIR